MFKEVNFAGTIGIDKKVPSVSAEGIEMDK